MSKIYRLMNSCVAIHLSIFAVSAAPSPPSPWSCAYSLCRFFPGNPPAKPASSEWSGWDKIENLVVFGASYASTGPDIIDPQPPYMTSCNGPNYIDLLTNGWNDSVIHTQQQAVGGSPVAWSVIGGHEGKYTNDFVNQVDGYVAAFTEAEPPGWSAANSIYHAEFGINDIYNSWQRSSKINPLIFHQYQEGFDKLYRIGARNFLILNVPPINRSPEAADNGQAITQGWKNDVADFNSRISSMISTLGTKYTNATFFHFDMNGLFTQVLDDPTYSTITQVYQDTTHTCKPYTNSPLPSMNYKSPDCAYPVNEYFWLNGYHPTYPVHDLTAAEIAYGLRSL